LSVNLLGQKHLKGFFSKGYIVDAFRHFLKTLFFFLRKVSTSEASGRGRHRQLVKFVMRGLGSTVRSMVGLRSSGNARAEKNGEGQGSSGRQTFEAAGEKSHVPSIFDLRTF
jgi:hypothetical protein